MRHVFIALVVCFALFCCYVQAKESTDTRLRAQGRADNAKKTSGKDMQTVLQQHLIGPNIANPNGNNDKEQRGNSGKEEKKGRLQTVGSVLGDIIGVLVSEVARFFGSVVSDVAREVTAHGFVNLFKQFADIFNGAAAVHAPTFG